MLSTTQLEKLKNTRDDDLLDCFPGYTRRELRILKRERKQPKILVFDIETSPLEVYTWGIYNQDIAIGQIQEDWFMLCWSAKWLFDKEIMSDSLSGKEAKRRDDKRITKSIWKLLNEADIVIAHNGKAFDIKKTNARFLKHNLPHPSYYEVIDTLLTARKEFRITSNKLDYLCRFLGLDQKVETGGFELWKRCIHGDTNALKQMETYCQNDVKILEELYLKLRPYMRNHPNLELYIEKGVCPNCGSKKIKEEGEYHTSRSVYKSYRCECGAISYKK